MIYALQDQAAQQCGVHVPDLNDGALCQNGRCYGVKNQELYYFDDNHLNSKGSWQVASKLEMLFQ